MFVEDNTTAKYLMTVNQSIIALNREMEKVTKQLQQFSKGTVLDPIVVVGP